MNREKERGEGRNEDELKKGREIGRVREMRGAVGYKRLGEKKEARIWLGMEEDVSVEEKER